jgi:hypothetical protein
LEEEQQEEEEEEEEFVFLNSSLLSLLSLRCEFASDGAGMQAHFVFPRAMAPGFERTK